VLESDEPLRDLEERDDIALALIAT